MVSRAANSAGAPAVLTLALYTAWVVCTLAIGHDIRDFANVGSHFGDVDAVPAIQADARHSFSSGGYDGQYFLAIARAPTKASPYLDYPQYRYSRIGYPVLAHVAALGQQPLIPYMLVAINVLAVALTTFFLARWLARLGTSPWFALVYAFFPGAFVAVQRDLSEALGYCFAAAGLLVFDRRRVRALLGSAALFGAAGIVRESAIVLAVGCVLEQLLSRGVASSRFERITAAASYGAAVVFPYLALRVLLALWLPSGGLPSGESPSPSHWPFKTIITHWKHGDVSYVEGVIAPAVLVGLVGLWGLARRQELRVLVPLLAAVLGFVVFAPSFAYDDPAGALRTSIGVPVAAVFSLPALDRATGGRRVWLWVAVALWCTPWGELLPFALNRSWS